jgi:hypothetical protein
MRHQNDCSRPVFKKPRQFAPHPKTRQIVERREWPECFAR